jgi:hypothetical protein
VCSGLNTREPVHNEIQDCNGTFTEQHRAFFSCRLSHLELGPRHLFLFYWLTVRNSKNLNMLRITSFVCYSPFQLYFSQVAAVRGWLKWVVASQPARLAAAVLEKEVD